MACTKSVRLDAVVRPAYYKYFHPKECLITNGITNREILRAAGKEASDESVGVSSTGWGFAQGQSAEVIPNDALHFVYPFGATLTVQKPAIPLLATGSIAIPLNRPIAAAYTHSVQQCSLSCQARVVHIDV